jgi:hypothetical protein
MALINMVEVNFKIKKEYAETILNAMHKYVKQNTSISELNKFSFAKSKTLEQAFEILDFVLVKDRNGDYVIEDFAGEKRSYWCDVLNYIAPYVERNSYIRFIDEYHKVYDFIFDGCVCQEKFVEDISNAEIEL